MWFVSDGGLRQFKVVGVLKANEGFERWGGGGWSWRRGWGSGGDVRWGCGRRVCVFDLIFPMEMGGCYLQDQACMCVVEMTGISFGSPDCVHHPEIAGRSHLNYLSLPLCTVLRCVLLDMTLGLDYEPVLLLEPITHRQ